LFAGVKLEISTKNKYMKRLCFIAFCVCLANCTSRYAEKEVFYIPNKYQGPIIVLFNKIDGAVKEYNNGARIYRIPSNGILYTKFAKVEGILDHKFYYVTDSGKIEESIPSLVLPILPNEKYDSTRIFVMEGLDGGFEDDGQYVAFCVGKTSISDRLVGAMHDLIQRAGDSYPRRID
jgi:hypothetical protein